VAAGAGRGRRHLAKSGGPDGRHQQRRPACPESTAAGVKHLLDQIRQRLPSTKVLLPTIFPRGEKPDDYLRGVNERENKLIAGYADSRSVHYLNINAALLNPDG
jgi:hypothetical protein